MPLQTTAVALQECADQIRQVAAGLDAAVARLLHADEEVRSKLHELEERVVANSRRIDEIAEECA